MDRRHFNAHGQIKRGFDTEVEARRWAFLLFAAGSHDCVSEVYPCPETGCGQFHLGGKDDDQTTALSTRLSLRAR